MASENQDFNMFAGDTKIISLVVADENENIVNLTGLNSAQFVIKKYPSSETASVTKTLGSGIANDTPTLGVLEITLSASDTASMSPGEYYHETRIKDSGNKIGTITTGKVTLKSATSLS
tara:strand:+ start:235 stop:591 length:357 start_codon:yes stop_codon:yes gene_type:complete